MRWAALIVLAAFLSGCAFVTIPLRSPAPELEEQVVGGSGRAKVVVADISGLIALERLGFDTLSKEPPLLPRFRETLEKAAADPRVVALVVRINSTGGTVTASDILFRDLNEFRRRKQVPVVACVMDRALSGGYYAALAADEILAHPTAVVGGVGVIAWRVDLSGLLDRWGVTAETVQSGPLKDFWSPLRGSRPAEVAIMQEIVDGLQQRFLRLVQDRRPLPPGRLEQVASGRIFAADMALELKLIDRIGYLDDAVDRARELAGIDEARTVLYRSRGVFAGNIYAGTPLLRETMLLEEIANDLLMPSFRYQVVQ